jgi:hypothetical protein
MPRQNRVTPLGELIATPERGLVFGNRGCLHDAAGRVRRHHSGRRWIACRLRFRGWRRSPLMQPGRYTELFFLDEATALAAGHRPCALCRRADYDRLVTLSPSGETGADGIDARLHAERTGAHRPADLDALPDGAFVWWAEAPHAVAGDQLLAWTPGGYGPRRPRPGGRAPLLTPLSLLPYLREHHDPLVPRLHPSAR